jgi:DNA polymerase-3 subunit gamma/tau
MLISISSGSYGQSSDNEGLQERIETLEQMIKSGAAVSITASQDQVTDIRAGVTANVTSESVQHIGAVGTPDSSNSQASVRENGNKKEKTEKVGSIEKLKEWPDVMQSLRKNGRMMLATYLASTYAVETDASTIMIVFPDSVGSLKDSVGKQEHLQVLESILCKVLSKTIRVKLADEEMMMELSGASHKAKASEESNLLKQSKEISSRLNVPLDIIEE